MSTTTFLTGSAKRAFDAVLNLRIAHSAVRRWGTRRAVRELRLYLSDPRGIHRGAANRYVLHGRDVLAMPDLPPLNSGAFINYLLDDVEALNHGTSAPLAFALVSVSSRCPYGCRYCYNVGDHDDVERLSEQTLVRTLRGLIDAGVRNLFLSGGEPMMRVEQLPALLDACRDRGAGLWLLSAGWGMDRVSLARLQRHGLRGVLISLDSRHEQDCVRSKGHPDAFAHATGAIRTASELGLSVSVNCVVSRPLLNAREFEAYLGFVGTLGARWVNCYSPHPIESAGEHALEPFGTAEFEALSALARANQRQPRRDPLPLAYFPDAWEALRGCVGGREFIYVDPRGQLMACPFLGEVVGSVADEEVQTLLGRLRNQLSRTGCTVARSLDFGPPD